MSHRPPRCCAFCCCLGGNPCQWACAPCQHPLFVALFRDGTDPRFWLRFGSFKVVGIMLSLINVLRNYTSEKFEIDVALCLLIGSGLTNLLCLIITRDVLKEALRTEHGATAVAALKCNSCQRCLCAPMLFLRCVCVQSWACIWSALRGLCRCLTCSRCCHDDEHDLDEDTYIILETGDEGDDDVETDREQENVERTIPVPISPSKRRKNRRHAVKMSKPLVPPTRMEAKERLYVWLDTKLALFDRSETHRDQVLRVWYKRSRYETWLRARVDQWILEHSGELNERSRDRFASSDGTEDVARGVLVERPRTQSVIATDANKALAIARVRWKLRELNFSLLQQRVVGRTLWVMFLQFLGGVMQNAGAVLILHHECDCTCKNFQWTVAVQCYWGLLSISLILGSCFDYAIRYTSNRYVLVLMNKILQIIVCVVFSVLQFVYLTSIFVFVFHDSHEHDFHPNEDRCANERAVKRYWVLQLIAAGVSVVFMTFIVLQKMYMKCFCPKTSTHIWSLGASLRSEDDGDGIPDIHRNGCWDSPF